MAVRAAAWLMGAMTCLLIAACGQNTAPNNTNERANINTRADQGNAGALVSEATSHTAKKSGMLSVHRALAAKVDAMPNLKWSVVVLEGNTAYVGAFPEHTGSPAPGARPRTGYDGPVMWDSPQRLKKQNPDMWIRAIEEWYPPANTYDHRPKVRSGLLPAAQQRAIAYMVKQSLPNVSKVLITTDIASASVLSGYADFLLAGGDMSPYMRDFHKRMALIWPGGKGVSPNRPSASPELGTIGRAADERTPLPSSQKQHERTH